MAFRTLPHDPSPRRVLLVGLAPLARAALVPELAAVAEVRAVAFPGEEFDLACESFYPDVVVVDVTYLAVNVVRPLILTRFSGGEATIVFFSDAGSGWLDEMRTLSSRPLRTVGVGTLTDIVRAPREAVPS
jgi:chemotaxis response regulator CheB